LEETLVKNDPNYQSDQALEESNEVEDQEILMPMFHIDSEDRAEWLLGKLANLKAELNRIAQRYDEISQMNINRQEALIIRFGDEMKEFCERKRAEPGFKGKTIKFIQADCNWRVQKGGARIEDAAACAEALKTEKRWDLLRAKLTVAPDAKSVEEAAAIAEINPDLFSISLEPVASGVKAAIEASGEIFPGVTIIKDVENFYIDGTKVGTL
jgi:phage host-nuclease inhibitor protein Gam